MRKKNPLLSDLAKDLKIVKSQKFLPWILDAHFNVYFAFPIETALKDVHIYYCSQNKVAFTEEGNNFGSAFVLHKTICLKGKPEQILDYLVYSG